MRTDTPFFITRDGVGRCIRPNRYALALASGAPLAAGVLALHENAITRCASRWLLVAPRQHVVPGTQRDNVHRMAATRRGGRRRLIRGDGRVERRARSVALREAVRHGWDRDAVAAPLLGSGEPTLW